MVAPRRRAAPQGRRARPAEPLRPRRLGARAHRAPLDFHYRIEIYVPEHKRLYGYYVLPFLLGDQIVGRVDLKADRRRAPCWSRRRTPSPSTPETAYELAEELRDLASVARSGRHRGPRQGRPRPGPCGRRALLNGWLRSERLETTGSPTMNSVLIRPVDLARIRDGEIDLAFRRWARPRLLVGIPRWRSATAPACPAATPRTRPSGGLRKYLSWSLLISPPLSRSGASR